MQQFNLHISIGNDAMTTGEDLARSLRELATRLEKEGDVTHMLARLTIRDANGNAVGEWTIGDLAVSVG